MVCAKLLAAYARHPNLTATQRAMIDAMSIDPPMPSAVAAETARCTPCAINAIRANLRTVDRVGHESCPSFRFWG